MLDLSSHTLVKNYTYISETDSALDKSDPDFENKWRLYLDGQGEPPLRGEPSKFVLRHLSAPCLKLLAPGLARANDEKEYYVACCYAAGTFAVVSVDNAEVNGAKVALTHEKKEGVSVLDAKSQDVLGFGLLVELGRVALGRRLASPL